MDETTEKTTEAIPKGTAAKPEEIVPALRESISLPGEGRVRPRRRRRVSYLTINKITQVDYKDVNLLRRFLNEHGRIVPSRQTGNTAKQQRMIARAVRRAREMALLPFVNTETSGERYTPYSRRSSYPRAAAAQPVQPAEPAESTQTGATGTSVSSEE